MIVQPWRTSLIETLEPKPDSDTTGLEKSRNGWHGLTLNREQNHVCSLAYTPYGVSFHPLKLLHFFCSWFPDLEHGTPPHFRIEQFLPKCKKLFVTYLVLIIMTV